MATGATEPYNGHTEYQAIVAHLGVHVDEFLFLQRKHNGGVRLVHMLEIELRDDNGESYHLSVTPHRDSLNIMCFSITNLHVDQVA